MKKINSLLSIIRQSLYKGKRPSSSRIFSYVMMSVIWLLGLIFASIEIGNAAISWKHGISYVQSVQSITIFGMILAHQLTLLGIYKSSETPASPIDSIIENTEFFDESSEINL